MQQLEPKYQNLNQLLSIRLFRIPSYQRSYSWEKKQRTDLFYDIKRVKEKNKNHFMATIVCLKTPDSQLLGSNEYFVYDIVDGQQRLTTLIALLKAIQKGLDRRSTDAKKEAEKLQDEILVRGREQLVLLQTNHDEARIFELYLKEGKKPDKEEVKTLAIYNLNNLFKDCEKFVNDWKKEESNLIELLAILKNKLGFIFYELNSENIVYTVFEVLNSRGLVVSYIDKVKSVLMGLVYEKYSDDKRNREHYTSQLKQKWADLYNLLGIKEINSDDLVKYTGTLLYNENQEKGKLLSTEESLEFFKDLGTNDDRNILNISETIYKIARNLKELSDIPILSFFYSISQVRLLYVSIKMNTFINDDDKEKILWAWEKISFRIYGLMGRDAKKKVGDYIRLARDINNNKIKNPYSSEDQGEEYNQFNSYSLPEKIVERIELIGAEAPIQHAIQYIKEENCYEYWGDELRYFFYKYEEYLANKLNIKNFDIKKWNSTILNHTIQETVEHIFPQTPNSSWAGKMGKGKNTIQNNVNRIGNLLILPGELNSQCGQKHFELKREIYKKALLHSVNDVIYENYMSPKNKKIRLDWNKEEIDKREERLIHAATEIWK